MQGRLTLSHFHCIAHRSTICGLYPEAFCGGSFLERQMPPRRCASAGCKPLLQHYCQSHQGLRGWVSQKQKYHGGGHLKTNKPTVVLLTGANGSPLAIMKHLQADSWGFVHRSFLKVVHQGSQAGHPSNAPLAARHKCLPPQPTEQLQKDPLQCTSSAASEQACSMAEPAFLCTPSIC